MTQENLRQDLANLYTAMQNHNAEMTADHANRKATGVPVLNPTFWFVDKDLITSAAQQQFASLPFINSRGPNTGAALDAAVKAVHNDALELSGKEFNEAFYASLGTCGIPEERPMELMADFYDATDCHG